MTQSIQLFITCLIDTLYPETAEAVVRILEHLGVQVEVPAGQTCCGQPAFNAGMRQQAKPAAMQTIRLFTQKTTPVIVPSGSCAGMIRHSYLELFAEDPIWLPRAQELSARTYELTEYIVDVLGVHDLNSHFQGKLTYHASCHLLRALGIDRQPRLLLSKVQDAQVVELPGADECCGFGGVFSAEHPEVSTEMLKRKIANLETSGATTLVACDAGCITNINGGLHRLGKKPCAMHIADVLDPARAAENKGVSQ
jgi:L-lactate dehydrogenase complex protein LldE